MADPYGTHLVMLEGNRIVCSEWCAQIPPHFDEYRANDVRPTAKQTAMFKALDAQPAPTEA